jgi:hypothetical protein
VEEGLAKVPLAVGRIAGAQPVEERPHLGRVGRRVRWTRLQEASELQADLLEDLLVAARDSVPGSLDRVERRMQMRRELPEPATRIQQTTTQQRAPKPLHRMQKLPAAGQPPA